MNFQNLDSARAPAGAPDSASPRQIEARLAALEAAFARQQAEIEGLRLAKASFSAVAKMLSAATPYQRKKARQQTTLKQADFPFPPRISGERRERLQQIILTVAAEFNMPPRHLRTRTNAPRIAFPRQVCMYALVKFGNLSLVQTGRLFGGMHHTTVMHAVEKIDFMKPPRGSALARALMRLDQDRDKEAS